MSIATSVQLSFNYMCKFQVCMGYVRPCDTWSYVSPFSSKNETFKLEKQKFHFHLNNMKWRHLFFLLFIYLVWANFFNWLKPPKPYLFVNMVWNYNNFWFFYVMSKNILVQHSWRFVHLRYHSLFFYIKIYCC
jgi:hypothetical protein